MNQNNLFQVLRVTRETLNEDRLVKPGMLIKRWLDIPGSGLSLFKVDSPLLSTAWSEKIAAELASKIDLPTVQYELAIDEENNRGVISPDFMNIGETELEGSDLLNQIYGRGNYLYTLDESINSIISNDIQLPTKWNNPPEINNAVDLFVGYLLFDSWINNTDRHDENWGIRICPDGHKELLPNFDCGISLGVRVSANDIEANRINVSRYSLIAKSMLFQQQGRSISNVSFPDLTRQLLDRYPVATKYWSERIVAVPSHEIEELFDRIPEGWIDQSAKNFAIELLEFNRQQIASTCELTISNLQNSPDDSPEPPNEPPEAPNPRNPPNSPKPSTPPSSPDATNSPDPPSSPNSSQSRPTDGDTAGIASLNIDTVQPKSQHLTDQQHDRQIMTNLEGFHGNAQNQVSTNAGDISKLAEQLGQALGLLGAESGAKAGKETIKAFMKIWRALQKEKEQAEAKSNNSIIAKSLADRKAGLEESKQKLREETREFRRDARKHAIKVGLDYIVSLLTNVKKFLKDVWDTPGKFFRGVKNKFTSLKDFMLQETKGDVNIGRELSGSKQEQAEKFIKLLNTSAGKQAPEGLENTIIAPWGENLIVVDAKNNVTANFIQPLMDNEFVQIAMDKNVVAAAVAPNIQPVPNSLASHELNLHGQLIGQDAIDQLLQKVQDTQLSKSTIQELEAVISEPAQVQVTAPIEPVQTQVAAPVEPLPAVKIEAKAATVVEELIEDPFKQPETQLVVITKAQLEDLSDDRSQDLKDVIYTDLGKNDEFGSLLEKMQAAADKFITNDEYAALEQFETTNVQALVQKLEANITAEEVNIPEFAQYLAENPNSLPQDQEADLKSIQIRTEKLADAKALLTFIETKYPAQQTTDTLEQSNYKLIDMSLSELIAERDAKINRAIVPHNSALTAEVRQQNLDQVLADPKYGEIQLSANETVLAVIQANTERLEYNRVENLARIDRRNSGLIEAQALLSPDQTQDLTQEIDKLAEFDQYHNQELATLAQLRLRMQQPELKPVVETSQLPLVPEVIAVGEDDKQALISPRVDFVPTIVTPRLASDLVTIAQLHQIGTHSDHSSLLLLKGSDDQTPLSISHTAQADGSAIYQVVDATNEFNFTVTSEQIVTRFNINRNNNLAQIRNLVTAVANVVKAPAQTNLKPDPSADVQRIETVGQLNSLLDRTIASPNLPAKSTVTLDSQRFGVRIDRADRKVVITDKTTLASMTLSKNGVEDGGLLTKMTEIAKEQGNSLAQRLARIVIEKTNEVRTVLDNAAPNLIAALDERATVDRATAQKVSKAANRLGAQVEGYIGQGIRNFQATNPQMVETVQQMKRVEQVGDANENQVKDNLQSAGEHLSDAPLSDAPGTESQGSLTADERKQLEQDFNAVVVHKSKAPTSSQAVQPVR